MNKALFEMPPGEYGAQWTIPPNFHRLNEMQRTLKIGLYRHLRVWSLSRIWDEYRVLVVAAALSLIFLILHGWLADRLVKRRTRELMASVEKEREAERQLANQQAHLESLERSGLIGQLSSAVAHDLKHPLAAVISLSRGMRRLIDQEADYLENDSGDAARIARQEKLLDELDTRLAEITEQTERAAGIIDEVRAHAAGGRGTPARISIPERTREIVESFRRLRHFEHPIHIWGDSAAESPRIRIRPMEFELAVLNLLKNAAEASREAGAPEITVSLWHDRGRAGFTISNNGRVVPPERLAAMQRFTAPTTKANGLGLGMGIVRFIAEENGGSVEITAREAGGINVRVGFPCAMDDEPVTNNENKDSKEPS